MLIGYMILESLNHEDFNTDLELSSYNWMTFNYLQIKKFEVQCKFHDLLYIYIEDKILNH